MDQTSEALPLLFESILKEYDPKRLFFARGPGSFMAIKITYIFFKNAQYYHLEFHFWHAMDLFLMRDDLFEQCAIFIL